MPQNCPGTHQHVIAPFSASTNPVFRVAILKATHAAATSNHPVIPLVATTIETAVMSDTSHKSYEEQRPKAEEAGVTQPVHHVEHSTVPLDLDDPHRAALEDNPD
jgi:hypothetical protein